MPGAWVPQQFASAAPRPPGPRAPRTAGAKLQDLRERASRRCCGPQAPTRRKRSRVARQHIERAPPTEPVEPSTATPIMRTDPQQREPEHQHRCGAVTLSMRSMTPPWPGNSVPLSFRPTKRLSRLSVRSPTTEKATAARHSGRKGSAGRRNQAAPASAHQAAQQHPAEHPFPGLGRGNLRRQVHAAEVPPAEECAGVGDATRSSNANSIHCAPCGEANAQAHQRQPGRHAAPARRRVPPTRRQRGAARAPPRASATHHQSKRQLQHEVAAAGADGDRPGRTHEQADQQHVRETQRRAGQRAETPTIPRRPAARPASPG